MCMVGVAGKTVFDDESTAMRPIAVLRMMLAPGNWEQ